MTHIMRPRAKDDIIRQFRYYLLQDAPTRQIAFFSP